jgi:hypothetical protein
VPWRKTGHLGRRASISPARRVALLGVGLRDITGVFSRYFIVGFFLPSFFTLLLLSISVHESALPHQYTDLKAHDRLFGIGGAALFAGLLLLGLRHPTWKLFEGVISDRLRLEFKTAFGSRSETYRARGKANWGLDPADAWPLLAPLMTQAERELHVDLETDARLFLNSAVGAAGIAAYWLIELLWRGLYWKALAFVFPVAISYLLYRAAVMTADRWYEQKLATAALHRLELYKSVGIAAENEKAAGEEASRLTRLGSSLR